MSEQEQVLRINSLMSYCETKACKGCMVKNQCKSVCGEKGTPQTIYADIIRLAELVETMEGVLSGKMCEDR